MAINTLLHLLTFTLLFTLTISSPSPSPSPAPPPESGSDDFSVPEPSLSPPPSTGSPPAPPPSDLSPDYDSPSLDLPSPPSSSPSPLLARSPVEVSDETAGVEREEAKESDSGGMSGGKKVGVAFGLIAAACFVGFGGVLYRKRQQNIRRARYSQSARLEFF